MGTGTMRAAGAEIDQLMNWLKPALGAKVLDVCCGGGRHLEALTQRGFDAVGVDLSPELLELAAGRKAMGSRLVRADVRCLPFDGVFDVALNLFTSFGYFDLKADDGRQLRGMARSLRSGGRLVLDLVHREHLEAHFKPHDHQQTDDLSIENHRTLTDTHVIKKSVVTTAGGQRHDIVEKVRLYTPLQIQSACRDAGLVDVSVHGTFGGGPIDNESPRMVVVGRCP